MTNSMNLNYGKSQLAFTFNTTPELFRIKEPDRSMDRSRFQRRISQELKRLNPDLSRTALVLGDKTRLCGYAEYLPVLLEVLVAHGADKERLKIYIAYGTHLPQDEAECLNCYGEVYREYPFIHHDSADPAAFEKLGCTRRGTDVLMRRDIVETSFLVTFGAVSHHYFAGYGGGRKLVFPGLGYRPAIYQNHALFLDKASRTLASGCKAGRITGNPLAEDLAEIESFRPADLAIHGILNSQGEVCDLLVGIGSGFFHEACARYAHYCEARTERQFDLVLASCGGFPKDINFIQSHKAIHNAAAFVEDGGQLIVLAECRDGVGSKTFLPWLELGSYQAAFDKLARNYEGNGGTALAMMEKLHRIRISLVTELDEATSQTIGFSKRTYQQTQALITAAAESIAVIPNASLLVNTR
jgi:nickel-dependent lactate racemase